jgi:hypothetical protein
MQNRLKHTLLMVLPVAALLSFTPMASARTAGEPQRHSDEHGDRYEAFHNQPHSSLKQMLDEGGNGRDTERYAYPTYQRDYEKPDEHDSSRQGWYSRGYEDERYSQPNEWRYGFYGWGW